jgi:hypothetical protein
MTTARFQLATVSPATPGSTTMRALVYHDLGKRAWGDKTLPTILGSDDAIERTTTSTICGEFRRPASGLSRLGP